MADGLQITYTVYTRDLNLSLCSQPIEVSVFEDINKKVAILLLLINQTSPNSSLFLNDCELSQPITVSPFFFYV